MTAWVGLPPIATDTITIVHPVIVTDHGAQVPDWSQPATVTTVEGCSVQPSGGSEDRAHRDQLGAQFTVFAPPETAVDALDRVYVGTYPSPLRLSAEPIRWAVGFLEHVQLHLVAWEG
jgi:hypothetical protein